MKSATDNHVPLSDNYTLLTTGPVGPVIRRMALPTIASMLVTSLYNIVDTYYVGQIDTQATAAVGVSFPVMAAISAVGFYFGQGAGTYISRKLGARDRDSAMVMAATSFFTAVLVGVVLAALGLLFLRPLCQWCGSTPTILPYTMRYLGVVMLGAPFMIGQLVLNNHMRFEGYASRAMWGLMTGAILNVVLVPIFIFGMDLGIWGAGIGTVLAQVGSFVVLWVMSRRSGGVKVSWPRMSLARSWQAQIFNGGMPSLLRQVLASVATLLLNVAAASHGGDSAIAAMSIVGRISFVVFSVILGIGQGFQPFCGFNYGAGLHHRVRQGFFFALRESLLFLAVCCVAGFVWAEPVIHALLPTDDAVVAIGATAWRWQIVAYPLTAFVTMANMCLQTSGHTWPAITVAACRNGIFFIPLILVLPACYGLLGVEMCQAWADVLSFLVALPLMVRYFGQLRRQDAVRQ